MEGSHFKDGAQNRAGQRIGEDRTREDRTGQNKRGQAGQDRTGQDRTGQDRCREEKRRKEVTCWWLCLSYTTCLPYAVSGRLQISCNGQMTERMKEVTKEEENKKLVGEKR